MHSKINNNQNLERLNFFFKKIFGDELDVSSFDNRIRLQKLIYILKHYGVKFPYNFTWWKHGPYSPQLADDAFKSNRKPNNIDIKRQELQLVEKIKNAKDILRDSRKAELIASFLYLKKSMAGKSSSEVVNELLSKKPYFTQKEINQTMGEWNKAEGHSKFNSNDNQ